MKPGRELDALVAEKVFGIHPKSGGCLCSMRQSCSSCDGRNGIESYSTELDTAWEVAEKVDLFNTYELFKVIPMGLKQKEYWVIGFHGDQYEEFGKGETAPHAICLAALKAVGVE